MTNWTAPVPCQQISMGKSKRWANADFDLSISEHSAGIGVTQALSQQSETSFSGLYHEDNGAMVDWGLRATHKSGGFRGAVGMKAMAYDLRGVAHMGWGLAPGASVGMNFTRSIYAQAEYYYAPSILSFNKTENMKQFDSRLVFAPMPNAELFLGYRDVKFKTSNKGTRKLHKGGYFGINFKI